MNIISDVASSPAVAAPIAIGISAANVLAILPMVINILTVLYLLLLVGHKCYVWYKDSKLAKQGISIVDRDE